MTAERLTIPPMPDIHRLKMAVHESGLGMAELDKLEIWGHKLADIAQAQARRADEAEADAKLWHVEVGQALGFVTTWQGRKEVVAEANRLRAEVEALKAQLAEARVQERERLARALAAHPMGNGFDYDDWMDEFRVALGGER